MIPNRFEEIGTIWTSSNSVGIILEWRIENYFSLSEMEGTYYYSPHISFGGKKWQFEIFPNGRDERYASLYVDLGLFRRFSGSPIRQALSLSIKTVKAEKYQETHCTKLFESYGYHAFNRFLLRSELSKRKSKLLPHGVLTIICTMKNMSTGSNSKTASVEHCHCKEAFDAVSLSSYQKKCMQRPIKCPDCLEVVVLQKWLDGHECQKKRPEAMKGHKEDSKKACVDAYTQIEKQDNAGSVCEDYKKVLLGGHNHDLIIKVGDKELRAHKDILRARSRVFESMLDHDMKEKNSGIIDVPDCHPDAMELFLSYVYCGEIESLDDSNMLGLYYVADKYEMMDLKRGCCNFIKKSLSLTNICNVIQLALNHSDSDLLEHATGYFSDNLLDIIQIVEWQSFLKSNSTVANELLVKSIKKLKNA